MRVRASRKALLIGITVGILLGFAAFTVGFYIDLLLHFCFELDFGQADGQGSCADEERAMLLWFWLAVVPIALLVGIGSGVGVTRLIQGRESRKRPS